MSGVRRWHVGRHSVREEHLGWFPCFVYPGAVTAGTNIALPDYAKPAKSIKQAIHLKQIGGGTVHAHIISYVKGTATTYVPDDSTLEGTSLAASAMITTAADAPTVDKLAPHTHGAQLTVVTTTPAAGQIQLVDENNVKLGDDTADGDVLLLIIERKP